MLTKSLPLILAMLFVFAGSAAAATVADMCYVNNLDASPDTFKDGQTINFKIVCTCKDEVNNVEIEIWYTKPGGIKDQVATKYGVTLGKGTHTVDVKGNNFRGHQGSYTAILKQKGTTITQHTEGTVCKSWSIGMF